jgi:hypothetical protein
MTLPNAIPRREDEFHSTGKKPVFWFALLLITFCSFWTRWYSLSLFELDWDEANRMSIAHSLNHGRVLYVDAWDHHTFLDILFFQQIFRLFPPETAPKAIHFINILILIGITWGIFWITWKETKSVAAGFAASFVAVFLFAQPAFRSSHGEFYHSATALAAFALLRGHVLIRGRFVAVGALLAIGFFIKQTAAFDAVALLGIHILDTPWHEAGRRDLARALLGIAAGVTGVTGACALYFWHQGAMGEAWEATFADAFRYSTGASLRETTAKYGGAAREEFTAAAGLHWLLTAGILLSYFRLFQKREARSDFGRAAWIWLGSVAAGIVFIGRFYEHYLIQWVVPLSFVIGFGLSTLSPLFRTPLTVVFGLLSCVPVVLLPRVDGFVNSPANRVEQIIPIKDYIKKHTVPGEGIFLYRNSALCLYFLTERFPPTKNYMDHQFLPENRDGPHLLAEAMKALAERPPKLVIVGELDRFIPEVDQWLLSNYEPAFKQGVFTVFRRR